MKLRITIRLVIIIGVVVLLLVGCNSRSNDRLLAQVGTSRLWESDLRQMLPKDRRAISVGELQSTVNRWVEHQLLFQEAMRRDLTEDKIYKQQLRKIREELIISRLRETIISDSFPDDQTLKAYYARTPTLWVTQTPEVRGWFWQSTDEKEITSLWRQTRTDLAPTGGVEFDWMPVSRLGPLTQDLLRLSPGFFTQPERWGNRWFFVQLADRRAAGVVKPFGEVREEVQLHYLIDRRDAKIDSLTASIRRRLIDKNQFSIADLSDLAYQDRSKSYLNSPSTSPKPAVSPSPKPESMDGEAIEELFRDMEKSERKGK